MDQNTIDRDLRETQLTLRAQRGDVAAQIELAEIAAPVIAMAVRKHLNGCTNDRAREDAEAECRLAFMETLNQFDAGRGTSIRTLWYYGFRRAVVGLVRKMAAYTTRECASVEEFSDAWDSSVGVRRHVAGALRRERPTEDDVYPDDPSQLMEAAEDADHRRWVVESAKAELDELRERPDWTDSVAAFEAWVHTGSYAEAARRLDVKPKTVANRARRVQKRLAARYARP